MDVLLEFNKNLGNLVVYVYVISERTLTSFTNSEMF